MAEDWQIVALAFTIGVPLFLVGIFFWSLRAEGRQIRSEIQHLVDAIKEMREAGAKEHEKMMARQDASIEQDKLNTEKIVEKIGKMEQRNSDQHAAFIAAMKEIK